MSEHTPGPWKAVYVGCSDWDLIGPVTEQDWKLAAAAPDLLDALLDALPFVEDAADDETYKAHRVHKVLKEIRKAIEKATGESCTS